MKNDENSYWTWVVKVNKDEEHVRANPDVLESNRATWKPRITDEEKLLLADFKRLKLQRILTTQEIRFLKLYVTAQMSLRKISKAMRMSKQRLCQIQEEVSKKLKTKLDV